MEAIKVERLCCIMKPLADHPHEAEGVLNPAAARGPDGALYLFPRLVGRGNYSRIGIARVVFDASGEPVAVERLGVALEPFADYELAGEGAGGCEDPRVSFVEPLGCYVMTYTALSAKGPRMALAVSDDLLAWRRLGLVRLRAGNEDAFDDADDKDFCVFPLSVAGAAGEAAIAMLHRPVFVDADSGRLPIPVPDNARQSIWIAYRPVARGRVSPGDICTFTAHDVLARPEQPWERLKIGSGTPPILTAHGWLIVYHGVSETGADAGKCYAAGIMLLDRTDPRIILHRSAEPVLSPETPGETDGAIANVVFPSGIDQRTDIGLPDRFDIYYGMADSRIGVARLDLPANFVRMIRAATSSTVRATGANA